jgi:hypothetical protein
MTDKIEPNDSTTRVEGELAEHRLPAELNVAVQRARQRKPDADQLLRCIGDAKRLRETRAAQPHRHSRSSRITQRVSILASLAAAAAVTYVILKWDMGTVVPEPVPTPPLSLSLPVYSPVTQIPFAEVGYRRIVADLDRADAELAQASEAIALSAVRLDVQQTLEEFYDWSEIGE